MHLTITPNVFLSVFISSYFFVVRSSALSIQGVFGSGAYINGSTERAVLDCSYTLKGNESTGLVIKWYHDYNPTPVYQWIPGSKPQALGILKGRLDLTYKSSGDELNSHSALAFVRPTVELSGRYACSVSTHLAEKRRTGMLIIYTPPSRFEIKISEASVSRLTMSCIAEGVHPEPKMELTKLEIRNKRRTILETSPEISRDARTNLFSISDQVTFLGYELVADIELGCLLTLPQTNYKLQETFIHRAIEKDDFSSPTTVSAMRNSGAKHKSQRWVSYVLSILCLVLMHIR